MAPKAKSKKPSPDDLLAEIRGRGPAKTYQFEDYLEVIHEMQLKGFSYAKISDFLTERLKYPITRGQIYRAYQFWLEAKEHMDREDAEAEHNARQMEPDFDPEEYERQKAEQKISEAVATVLKYAMEKYPKGALSCDTEGLFKRIVSMFDEKVRDDFEAEQADKRLASQKSDPTP